MDNFKAIYLDLLSEAQYDSDKWRRQDTYHGMEIYIRKDSHLQDRLNERYENISKNKVIVIIKKFLKEELKKSENIFNTTNMSDIPFTFKGILSNVYVAGRFKKIGNIWQCYVVTVLPAENPYISRDDMYAEVLS